LVLGLPVVVQDNVCLEFGVANGTTGTLHGWLLDAREPAFEATADHDLLYMPYVLFVKLDKYPDYVKMEGLEHGVIPLLPKCVNFEVEMEKMKVPIVREGFLLGVSIATTVHKVQGRTVPKAIVDLVERVDYSKLVVALSRVTSAAGLRIKRPFDRSVLLNAPSVELQCMEDTLRGMHDRTTERRAGLWSYCIRNE